MATNHVPHPKGCGLSVSLCLSARQIDTLPASCFETNGKTRRFPNSFPSLGHRRALPSCICMVSGSFHLLLWILFTFYSRYYFAIGLQECLALDVNATHLQTGYPTRPTLETLTQLLKLRLRGHHPLWPGLPACSARFLSCKGSNPHAHWLTPANSVCALLLSVAPTNSIPVGFSSCGY